MAEAATVAGATPQSTPLEKKSLLRRAIGPLLCVLVGATVGAATVWFLPNGALNADAPKITPKVAPLSYVEIENSFTSNLKDTGRFVQIKVAISTQGGPPVTEAVERHKIAIIAALLAVLADTTEEELSAEGGREALARKMRQVINDTLQRKSGIAGIDDVFFTSYILQ